jgi:CheY-like chemotaxis protein
MKKQGPIIIIEDDLDDQELLEETFTLLNYPNPVIFFTNGNKALEYIQETGIHPFLIISDINMPEINGFEIRNKIHENQELKDLCIPYVFLTTGSQTNVGSDSRTVTEQGFFVKPNSMEALRHTIRTIVEYWQACATPRQYKVA